MTEERKSLVTEFDELFKTFLSKFRDAYNEHPTPAECSDITELLRRLARATDEAQLYSNNEELDDVPTQSLRFFLIPAMIGEVLYSWPEISGRLDRLQNALIFWGIYLRRLFLLGLCFDNNVDGVSDLANRRDRKIEQFRETRRLDEKLKFFRATIEGSKSVVDEEDYREYFVVLLQRFARDAIDNSSLASREIDLIESKENLSKVPTPLPPPRPPVVITSAMLRSMPKSELKDYYRERVFEPFIEMPTVTLAEVADYEFSIEVKKQIPKPRKDSDVIDEEAEEKARKWDDWKDRNPRGWGNKNRNLG